jgi:hypothetical protein
MMSRHTLRCPRDDRVAFPLAISTSLPVPWMMANLSYHVSIKPASAKMRDAAEFEKPSCGLGPLLLSQRLCARYDLTEDTTLFDLLARSSEPGLKAQKDNAIIISSFTRRPVASVRSELKKGCDRYAAVG